MHNPGSRVGSRSALVLAVQLSLLAMAATAQAESSGEAASSERSPTQLDAIRVTVGTRRGDQTALQSAAPVDVISAEQLASTGASDLNQALQKAIPSINFPFTRASATVAANKTLSMRGMQPDQVLILVNGKRHHANPVVNTSDGFGRGSQGVDISSIPISAIERVEVLRDGAAAQYGSDAIAGVINIVLKQANDGGGIDTEFGGLTKGDGDYRKYSAWKGFSLPGDGFLTLAAEYEKSGFINLVHATDTRTYYPSDSSKEATATRDWKSGIGSYEGHSVLINAGTHVNDKLELYGTVNYRKRESWNIGPYRLPESTSNVLAVYPNGYQPWIIGKTEDRYVIGGAKYSDAALGNFDFSVTYGRSNLELSTVNNLNPSYGANSPTS